MPDNDQSQRTDRERITSVQLSRRSAVICWLVGLTAAGGGAAATFLTDNQAGTAALIVLGAGAIFLALIRRVPLRLEVAGATLDATYLLDGAFDVGREGGVALGLDLAAKEVRASLEEGPSPGETDRDVVEGVLDRLIIRRESLSLPDLVQDQFADESGYRGPVASQVAGVTVRQLDYWGRTDLVVPSVRLEGGGRLYSLSDIVLLKVVKRLLDTGVSLQNIRVAVEHLRELDIDELARITILSDGSHVFEARSPEEVVELLASGHGVFGISLKGAVAEVYERLAQLAGRE